MKETEVQDLVKKCPSFELKNITFGLENGKITGFIGRNSVRKTTTIKSMTCVIFGLFNWIFVGGFFKTAYKFARPFVTFIIACFLVIFTAEALHHIPGLEKLNAFGTNEITIQLIMIVAGILIFLLVTVGIYLVYRNYKRILGKYS